MSDTLPVQYSKIRIRRGPAAELPGIPSMNSDIPTQGLDIGEFGYTTDLGRLFIGIDPTSGLPQVMRSVFPYGNIEVITENSSQFLQSSFDAHFEDTQTGYFQSDQLTQQSSDLNTFYNVTINSIPFIINVAGNPGQAQIYYNLFQVNLEAGQPPLPVKTGVLKIVYGYNSLPPSLTDVGSCFQNMAYGGTDPNHAFGGFLFQAIYLNGNVVLQYSNVTSLQPTICFRIERAVAPPPM